MAKRERILVGLMVIALCYGAFVLISSLVNTAPTQEEVQREANDAQNLSAQASQALNKDNLDVKLYVLKTASAQWSRDPFAHLPESDLEPTEEQKPGPEMDEQEEELPKLQYSGYLEMNQTQMAVINGIEYQLGEELEQVNYVLVNIEPGSVTLKSRDSQERITVPYQDNGFD